MPEFLYGIFNMTTKKNDTKQAKLFLVLPGRTSHPEVVSEYSDKLQTDKKRSRNRYFVF